MLLICRRVAEHVQTVAVIIESVHENGLINHSVSEYEITFDCC